MQSRTQRIQLRLPGDAVAKNASHLVIRGRGSDEIGGSRLAAQCNRCDMYSYVRDPVARSFI